MKPIAVLAAAALAAASLSAQAVGRLADIRIYDRSAGRELPVHWHQGRAYVVGQPGNEYQVVVRNRAGEDVLAVVSVDGVNVVSGETASMRQGGYVLGPWDTTRIGGWRKSLGETAAFYFTSLGDSYAARTDRPQNVGVIGVALFQRRLPPPPPVYQWDRRHEYDESRSRDAHPSAPRAEMAEPQHAAPGAGLGSKRLQPAPSAPLGTGHGRREHDPVREVAFERRTSEPVETITIYYDSHRNLVAQGVIPSYRTPRDPNPFPTRFAPDPWR